MNSYACARCGLAGVRLYRIYGNFLRAGEVSCNEHIPPALDRGWWVPLVEDDEGQVWGYTSAPARDIDRWLALPDAAEPGPRWVQNVWVAA